MKEVLDVVLPSLEVCSFFCTMSCFVVEGLPVNSDGWPLKKLGTVAY